ncbi:nuclear transport factor 2 family protein [Gordonia sp. PDNC005]|uniref:nuclear transport factor 2 family protein n=1 Tax=unclassified Gordonia (in: high G+C Gram-positive bacteria) TaxID=2657482 RepID=UPI00196592CC|nr:nuclear transport factor 2 family protein [Gordonia sp. PDNC005]QRY61986.1 nuclear transport factor 2 family protein [Gordonia sp. PDNC005]
MNHRQTKLATAQGSPAAVAAHDKAAWLALFTDDGIVNDPVGSAPHRGSDELSAFYETFIAPNDVVFHPHHDIVCDDVVVRDVTLEIRMSDAVVLSVPVHLRYEMEEPDRIAGLYAHWELPTMIRQMLSKGLAAAPISVRLTKLLLQNQGLAGTAGFSRGFVRVGAREKRAALEHLHATQPNWTAGKCLAAGRYVTVSLSSADEHAVAMVEFSGRAISDVTLFTDR